MADMNSKASERVLRISSHLANEDGHTNLRSTPVHRDVSAGVNTTSDAARKVLATRKSIPVLDSTISYLDTGIVGDHVVLFLHGNPTAAYLWRNIIPHVQGVARCLAPDLIGMGHSGKEPNNSYRFFDHYKYLSAWIDAMDLPRGKHINLVIHDWGSGLGFHWSNQHRERVQSITYMEALVGPVPSWNGWPEQAKNIFQALRSPSGEEMVLEKNFFVEKLLPGAVLRKLSDEEMEEYLLPYKEAGESRRPTLTWPREIPVEGKPLDVARAAEAWFIWLASDASLPKLYIDSDPGFFAPGLRIVVQSLPNQKVVKAKGSHFVQEDSPNEIGKAIAEFLVKDVFK